MNILVTGATGFLGRNVCNSLVKRGHDVKILVRRGAKYSNFPVPLSNVFEIGWPYGITEDIAKNIDLIVHCANSPESRNHEIAHDQNVLSTELLCKAAEKNKSSLIYISSQSANKDIDSLYAKNKLASEEYIKNHFNGIWTIIRPGMIYGPGASGLFSKMQGIVKKFKFVPLIDGGKQVIQPIHVKEIAEAIAKISSNVRKHSKKTYYLGDNNGITLKKFLELSAGGKVGFINIPHSIVIPAVNFANSLMNMPITESNIQGLIKINKMNTAESLSSLGINLMEVNEKNIALGDKIQSYSPLKVILIGAGKMGTLHYHNIKEFPRLNLAGIVEKDKNKAKFLNSFGKKVKIFENLHDAIKETKPNIAIICTPTFTHLKIIEECVKNGISCFVEKPLVLNEEEGRKIKELMKKNKKIKLSVGYLTSHHKHVEYLKENLEKKFGKIKNIEAFYFLSHVMGKGKETWETKKELSGGGVVLNAAVHTLNTLSYIVGTDYRIIDKKVEKINSKEVEDSLSANVTMNGKKVKLEFNWSKPGYPAADTLIKFYTSKGEVWVDNLGFMFKSKKGKKEFMFSDTKDISFNFSAEAGSSGFFNEINNFIDNVIKNKEPINNAEWAIKIEKFAQDLTK